MASPLPPFVLNWPSSSGDLLVAETDTAKLHRYSRSVDGEIEHEQVYLSVGLNGVGKRREWDQKTPLGVYLVTSELDTSRLHQKYGVNAFPLDYPNARDRQLGRTGSGIWLHGVLPGGGRRPERDTDGCLAIPNDDLLRLTPRVVPGETTVVISRRLPEPDRHQHTDDRDRLLDGIETWRQRVERGDLRGLRDLYHDAFDYEGLDRDGWIASGLAVSEKGTTGVRVSDILLVADPVEPDLYVSRFRLSIEKGPHSRALTKRLYWLRDDEDYRIVAEDAY